MDVFLGIDQGSSSSKGALISSTGEMVWDMSVPVSASFLSATKIEQDPEELLGSIYELISQAQDYASKKKSLKICGSGFAFQRSGVCAWERSSGKARSKMLPWRDMRTSARIKTRGASREELWNKASLPLSSHYSGGKISLLQEEYRDPAILIGTLDSYILANLIPGSFVSEDSMAHRTMLYSLESGDWDPALCESFGVERERLAQIEPSLRHYGKFNGIPILASLGDQQAGLFYHRQLGFKSVLNLGTIASLLVDTGSVLKSCPGYITSVFYSSQRDIKRHREFVVEGTTNCCGRTFIELEERFQVRPSEIDSFCKEARGEIPIAFCPFGAISTPDWKENVPDLITGWKDTKDIPSLTRALMENIVFFVLEDLENLKSAEIIDPETSFLPVSGGASETAFLMQRLADCSGLKILKVASSNATVQGAALAALHALHGRSKLELDLKSRVISEYLPTNSKGISNRFREWKELKKRAISGDYDQTQSYQNIVKQL